MAPRPGSLGHNGDAHPEADGGGSIRGGHAKWSLGVLNDKKAAEVPGSVLLLSSPTRQRPLGLHLQPARTSSSSLPSQPGPNSPEYSSSSNKKRTANGKIILDPQPDDSLNDPLNWPVLRRNTALFSLGWHCLVGGGMTPILAAGFKSVAKTYHVTVPQVALTTGLYMMGMGIGSVVTSPTAILYGKRPVYLVGTLVFLASSVWCSESPSYISLVIARIVMGLSVSPCESLPSATIAEIFFLHERAYRVGIYTLLLLGGKNLVPLVSAVIIQSLGWRWVFRVVAIILAFNFTLLFFFVPETFWDRTPRPKKILDRQMLSPLLVDESKHGVAPSGAASSSNNRDTLRSEKKQDDLAHVQWAERIEETLATGHGAHNQRDLEDPPTDGSHQEPKAMRKANMGDSEANVHRASNTNKDGNPISNKEQTIDHDAPDSPTPLSYLEPEKPQPFPSDTPGPDASVLSSYLYTETLKQQPPLKFGQTLKPWNGRLRKDNWFRVAIRPLILFAYPAVLWSALVYSLAVGWLIVLSETVASVYQHNPYNFTPLGTGLVYLSPFIGGILGTVVAGKVSDIVVRFMTKQNGGVYEPEFRLVMAFPVAVCTSLGLMGFGWSADVGDKWIVPTVFFGIISFGCSLGSTTAITFCVDSYRQYAGEALVTLNFSKNIFHGLVFSLFLNRWLDAQGSKRVFLALGGIQMACLAFTIPLYIFGKRARMWTVRMNFMERF
ncbi:MAG: hypothetical protein M1839_008293 [Geoglossum umbratile]|nr:MAG: hypothetical protein M1839_008293 [Geoglossum umbratile]